MATIVTDATSGSTFTPNDGDIYFLENNEQGTFTSLCDADFEVQFSQSGAYGQGSLGNSAVRLNCEEDTSPTVTVGDTVTAGAVRFNANGDSLDTSGGTGSTTGVIAGDGPHSFGDRLNADGYGFTVNFANGSNATNSIIGSGSGQSTPAEELNGSTQTITIGDNMTRGGVASAPPLPDDAIDGENSAALMGEGYDYSEGATDSVGVQIGSGRNMPSCLVTCDAGFRAAIGFKAHTRKSTNGSTAIAPDINLGEHANGNY